MEENKVEPSMKKTNTPRKSKKKAEMDKTAHSKKYIMWENKDNICWLDASMALIAHNQVMKRASQVSENSIINKIIEGHAAAISDINNLEKISHSWPDTLNDAKKKLNSVQERTLNYLKPILKFKPGDPDSAFCSLYNFLKEDFVIKCMFDVTWISIKTCTNCGNTSQNTKTKPLITLSKVDSFDPESPTVIYNCSCDKSEQKIQIVFVALPPCLIFHFENGAGQKKPPLSFVTKERLYYLTGIMTLEKGQESNVDHFIFWVRDPFSEKWLDCNDLNPDIVYFAPNFPDISFLDVSFYVYESFDDLGTIHDYKLLNIKNSEEDIVLIDISEESESDHSNSVSNASGSDINIKKQEVLSTESQVTTFSNDSSKSQKEILARDEEHIQNKALLPEKELHSPDLGGKKPEDITKEDIGNSENDINVKKQEVLSTESQVITFSKDSSKSQKEILARDEEHIQNRALLPEKELHSPDLVGKKPEDITKEDIANSGTNINVKKQEVLSTEFSKDSSKSQKEILTRDEEHIQNKALLPEKKLNSPDLEGKKTEDITKEDIANSGTSYVKLSVRRKKYPGITVLGKTSLKTGEKPASDNTKITSVRKIQRSVKVEEDQMNSCSDQNQTSEDNTISPYKEKKLNAEAVEKQKGLKVKEDKQNKALLPAKEIVSDLGKRNLEDITKADIAESGTSYVKVSFRRKKCPHPAFLGQNDNKPSKNGKKLASDNTKTTSIRKSPRSVNEMKNLKQKRDEEWDTPHQKRPRKNEKFEKTLEELQSNTNEEDVSHSVLNKDSRLSSKNKFKIKNTVGKKKIQQKHKISHLTSKNNKVPKEHNGVFTNQQAYSSMLSATGKSNVIDNDEGKVLEDFEDAWSTHVPGCNCEQANLEETIDTVVDYTFAYLCKLSQVLKKANTH